MEREAAGINEGKRGRLWTGPGMRAAYATDASLFQTLPRGVFFPEDEADLRGFLENVRPSGETLLARGAGTALAGQAITSGFIVDMTAWKQFRIEDDSAVCGPGVVIDAIDAAAGPRGLRFGPAPASSNRATIGGLIANNGTGARSIRYGMCVDSVLGLKVLLADGSIRWFRDGDLDEKDERERRILELAVKVKDDPHWPRTWRNVSGYNLRGVIERRSLLPLFCGSEGRLGIILEAEVRLYPLPKKTRLEIYLFDDLVRAMEIVPELLKTDPSAIELLDRVLLDLARRSPHYHTGIIEGEPEAVLIVEYEESEEEKGDRRAEIGPVPTKILENPMHQKELWDLRKEGLGILMSRRGGRRPIPFIEDCAVPVERLAEYVRRLKDLLRQHRTEAAFYAHASAGCLHIRPLLDLRDSADRDRMAVIQEATADLVAELGGTMAAEHGDGAVRGHLIEKIHGSRIAEAFRGVKKLLDPDDLFGTREKPVLRAEVRYAREKPFLKWPEDFTRELDRCNGEAACRKSTGVMCPSFQVSGDERLSTRGRANLRRFWSAMRAGGEGARLFEREGREERERDQLLEELEREVTWSLKRCLACRGCASECPSRVDMALFKAEWFGRKTPSPADYFFGNYRLWAHLGRLIPLRPPRGLLELVGVHPFVPLPFPVKKGLMVERKGEGSSTGEGSAIRVFLDTHIEFFEPEIGEALVRLLKRRGLGVSFVDAGCCGRPAFSRGMLEKARREARKVLGNLGNTPTVIVEPSCLSIFRLDARSLGITIAGEETRLLSPAEFLADLEKTFDTSRRDRIFFHPHCHSRAMDQERLWARVLERFGEVTVSDAGCCGMAGGFGYDRETVALATAVAEDRFLPELRRAGKEGKILLVEGRSCREMAHRAGIKTRHPLEYIAGRLDGAEGRMR